MVKSIDVIKTKIHNFNRWLNKPVSFDDNLIVYLIRIVKKKYFPHTCEWIYVQPFERKCSICGDYQKAMYHRFGDIRLSWKSFRDLDRLIW